MSRIRHAGRPPERQRAWLFWLLLAAWLTAQTLGLLHREMHGHGPHTAVQTAGQGDPFHSGAAAADCVLYDHACLADTLPGCAAALLPQVPPGTLAALSALPLLARAPPPFQARGPPASQA